MGVVIAALAPVEIGLTPAMQRALARWRAWSERGQFPYEHDQLLEECAYAGLTTAEFGKRLREQASVALAIVEGAP